MKHFKIDLRHLLFIILTLLSNRAPVVFGGVHLSLSGSHSESNAGLQKIESAGASAGLAFDVFDYVRLGYSHRQELAASKGWKYYKTTDTYTKFSSSSHIISHSIDLTLILYAGEIFMPYVFVGYGTKSYHILSKEEGQEDEKIDAEGVPNPSAGAGLSVRLSQRFSLKVSHTLSLVTKEVPGKKAEGATDTYTQVGISYSL